MVRFSILTRNREISFERERMRFLASSFARSSALFSICEFECAKTTFVAILLLIWYHISLHNIRGSVKLPFCIYQEGEIPLNLATSHNISFWRLMANPNPLSLSHALIYSDRFLYFYMGRPISTTRSSHKFNSRTLCRECERALDSITGAGCKRSAERERDRKQRERINPKWAIAVKLWFCGFWIFYMAYSGQHSALLNHIDFEKWTKQMVNTWYSEWLYQIVCFFPLLFSSWWSVSIFIFPRILYIYTIVYL